MEDQSTLTREERAAKALELLPEFRKSLGALADGVDDGNLLKFLRWKPSIDRATERFRDHVQWKKDNPGLFDDNLRLSKDKELKRIVESNVIIAPEELRIKTGGPVLVGRLRNNDMTDGRSPTNVARMILYTLDRVLEREDAQLDGIVIFHDLKGLDKSKNLHLEIPKLIFGAIIGNFPMRIKGIYILNAPWFFSSFFAVVSRLFLPPKIRQRVHYINDISDLGEAGIDVKDLLVEHGGTRDFDVTGWTNLHEQREENDTFDTLTQIKVET